MKDFEIPKELLDLIHDCYNEGYKKAYEKGLEDAWECAKRIALNLCDGGIGVGRDVSYKILKNFSAQEAIDKIKAWEEKSGQSDDEIKIGDEVNVLGFNAPVVVIALHDDAVKVMNLYGDTGVHSKYNITKTGKHLDQISEVFEQLRK